MQQEQEEKLKFGLIGKNISYSFSKNYFSNKFKALGLNAYTYENFDIEAIEKITQVIRDNENLKGLNVTIPYKEQVIDYLAEIDEEAQDIGAVNTIKFLADGSMKGYNTDVYGFEMSITPFIHESHKKALILGTGGASKAVDFVLRKLKKETLFVSRNPKSENEISYKDLSKRVFHDYKIIVNCTPLGTYPEIRQCPKIPYQYLTEGHLLYDLIYNPSLTTFLKEGKKRECSIINGEKMLQLQAEKAWEIWNL